MTRTRLIAGALCALAASSAAAATLTRQPYLQSVTQTSAIVAFRSDVSCAATVRWGTGALDQSASSPAGTKHAVAVTGLAPGAEYQYAVEICGATAVSGKRLRTAAPPTKRDVHFAASADFGTGGTAQKAVGAVMQRNDPDLFLAAGDIAYDNGTEAEYQDHLFVPFAAFLDEVPIFAATGNHEYNTSLADPYVTNLHLPTNNPQKSERYYSFDWGHVHFVAIDSSCRGASATPDCTPELQKAWLEQDLAATTQPWKVVFFHHPPYSTGEHGSSLPMRDTFVPTLEKYGVDLVVTGHDHNYERTKPIKAGQVVPAGTEGAITYVVVGNGGAALRAWTLGVQPWDAYRNNTDHGYLDVKVVDGVLTAEMLSTTGAALDRFTLSKTLPPLATTDGAATPGEPGAGAPASPTTTDPNAPAPAQDGGGGSGTPGVSGGPQSGCGTNAGTAALLGLVALGAWSFARRRERGFVAVPALRRDRRRRS